ncbi:uncharacterized protein LOC113314148 isoform X2 [Papaver somniferum]|uniref:uncharacterized protein LOC113314148 isoform X2 n=1 Tax=Papaver somniferum TaxID=3469 RepID=UPI000E702ED3|nr:uncharacterized protein LOC113314148 isoform X2 [Papaver somniferum]
MSGRRINPPCKEWFTARKGSPRFIEGVKSFIQFTADSLGEDINQFHCTCMKCQNYNSRPKTLDEIHGDILDHGFDVTYRTWIHHGEKPRENNSTVRASALPTNNVVSEASFPRMVDLFLDTLGRTELGNHENGAIDEDSSNANVEDDSGANVEGGAGASVEDGVDADFRKRMLDALQPLYPDCGGEHTKLSTVIELLSLKARYQCSNVFFTELLKFMKTILPEGNTLPSTCAKAKGMLKPFNLPVEIIHACFNDCILYRKENADYEECPKCHASRWKVPPEGSDPNARKVPVKKLRFFPITERLQRWYGTPWIAEQMYYHSNVEESITHMRHPVDSSSWKSIDRKWPEFASEKRNVRLGLATDGFNPFGMMTTHSTWPVMVFPFNLPPSVCTSNDFTLLSLLIPGPSGPNGNIDVYLQPLIDELIELWLKGKLTYDAHTKTSFTMKAILMWCIHDYPAYAYMSGLRTSGKFGCPACGEDTEALRLKWGNKFAYMGHRRFLRDRSHPYRRETDKFNGFKEDRGAPIRLSGVELFDRTATANKEFGKMVKRSLVDSPYSKRSILYNLPYWKFLQLLHNVDVMHVEKNFAEKMFGTFMNHKDKSKDGDPARKDLELLNLKPDLWLTETNGKVERPPAPYCLPKNERELVCKTFSKLKVPIGYSGNWKKKVDMKELQFKCLKSHDYHMLMQGLMPIFLMYCFKDHKLLREAIHQLSLFFKVLCSKVIDREALRLMHERIVESLCVFEMYFPPAFFVTMTHLVVHLAEEALTLGPVQFRWMYPFERFMDGTKTILKGQ